MKYSSKLTVLIVIAILSSNIMLFSLTYYKAHQALFKEVQDNALSIAASCAQQLDGDLVASIRERKDEGNDAYKTLEAQMRRLRDANRKAGTYVSYIYTMRMSDEKAGMVVFGVDAEEDPENKSHVGDVYKGTFGTDFKVADKYIVEDEPSKDQWGTWISAYAPIKDRSGKVVAMLGVDLQYQDVKDKTTNSIIKWGVTFIALTMLAAALLSFLLARHVSRPLTALHKTVEAIGSGDLKSKADVSGKDEFGDLARAVNNMAEGLRQREVLKGSFARYVSSHVMENILKEGESIALSGERRKVTVLFSDIRGFTSLSENMRPEEVVSHLNEYFERMVDIVFRNKGTLDKFIGDGIMAIFGAPQDDEHQEEHAIMAALEMRRELDVLCGKWEQEGRPKINIGIGVNTGTAIVGNIGSMQYMEYTAIGDTVNLASRLEVLTKELGANILISEYTYVTVRNLFKTERIKDISIRGRADLIAVYSVLGVREN